MSHSAQVEDQQKTSVSLQIEADALFDLLYDEYPLVKFWISFQCKDGSTLAHGENFAETVRNLFQKARTHKRGPGNLLAVGVNCTHPAHVTSLFESVNGGVPANERMPLIVYPNSGEIFDAKKGFVRISHLLFLCPPPRKPPLTLALFPQLERQVKLHSCGAARCRLDKIGRCVYWRLLSRVSQ